MTARCPRCGDWRANPVELHTGEALLAFGDLLRLVCGGAFREARCAARDMRCSGRDAIGAIECGRHDAPEASR